MKIMIAYTILTYIVFPFLYTYNHSLDEMKAFKLQWTFAPFLFWGELMTLVADVIVVSIIKMKRYFDEKR